MGAAGRGDARGECWGGARGSPARAARSGLCDLCDEGRGLDDWADAASRNDCAVARRWSTRSPTECHLRQQPSQNAASQLMHVAAAGPAQSSHATPGGCTPGPATGSGDSAVVGPAGAAVPSPLASGTAAGRASLDRVEGRVHEDLLRP